MEGFENIEPIMGELGGYNSGAAAAGGFAAAMAGLMIGLIFGLLIYLVLSFFMGKVFVKAGQPMWAAFVPIYNLYIMTLIIDRPWWVLLLVFIPGVGTLLVMLLLYLELAKSFGKDIIFGILLTFLSPIMLPILAFGDAEYQGPQHVFNF